MRHKPVNTSLGEFIVFYFTLILQIFISKENFVTLSAQILLVLRITLDDHDVNGFAKYIYTRGLVSTA